MVLVSVDLLMLISDKQWLLLLLAFIRVAAVDLLVLPMFPLKSTTSLKYFFRRAISHLYFCRRSIPHLQFCCCCLAMIMTGLLPCTCSFLSFKYLNTVLLICMYRDLAILPFRTTRSPPPPKHFGSMIVDTAFCISKVAMTS